MPSHSGDSSALDVIPNRQLPGTCRRQQYKKQFILAKKPPSGYRQSGEMAAALCLCQLSGSATTEEGLGTADERLLSQVTPRKGLCYTQLASQDPGPGSSSLSYRAGAESAASHVLSAVSNEHLLLRLPILAALSLCGQNGELRREAASSPPTGT